MVLQVVTGFFFTKDPIGRLPEPEKTVDIDDGVGSLQKLFFLFVA
jgi:hypothetical protein